MSTRIALLRGVNVGGRNRVAMAALRGMLATLGFAGARTLLQSGNVLFAGDGRTDAGLERLLEAETMRRLKVRVDWFVRTPREWTTIVARNPFPGEAERDPRHLLVVFLKKPPAAGDVRALQAATRGPERIRAAGRQLYIVYPEGIGRSKLTATLIEHRLDTRGTARNWNTVLKLQALARD
jgi:uncharacterized protein (DUF1697 family)